MPLCFSSISVPVLVCWRCLCQHLHDAVFDILGIKFCRIHVAMVHNAVQCCHYTSHGSVVLLALLPARCGWDRLMANSRLNCVWLGVRWLLLPPCFIGESLCQFMASLGTVPMGGYLIVPCILCPVCHFCHIVCLKQDVNLGYASRMCYICTG